MNFDQQQLNAITRAATSRFSIINGGAGCGKTTIIKAVAERLAQAGKDVLLCAFAGKAAARLAEATGREASTIHRMLGYMGDLGFTVRHLHGSTVILDEASMVSSDLMAEIAKRKPDALILVGDEAQLVPVGAGQPFHDLIRLLPDKVATLTTCYRNKEAIYKAALKIRAGQMPDSFQDTTDNEKWLIDPAGNAQQTHARILTAVRSGEIDFTQDIIICPRNGEDPDQPCCVESLNRDIKAIVNPSKGKIATGDRIVNTKNMADLDIWNGTTATVKTLDTGGGCWLTLDFPIRRSDGTEEHTVLVPKDSVKHLELAYAMTVHKSQGSQYCKVIFVTLTRDTKTLLNRSMLYTGVTRARRECIVIGEPEALRAAVKTATHRHTVMQELQKASC